MPQKCHRLEEGRTWSLFGSIIAPDMSWRAQVPCLYNLSTEVITRLRGHGTVGLPLDMGYFAFLPHPGVILKKIAHWLYDIHIRSQLGCLSSDTLQGYPLLTDPNLASFKSAGRLSVTKVSRHSCPSVRVHKVS